MRPTLLDRLSPPCHKAAMRRLPIPLAVAIVSLLTIDCGKSGSRDTRPIEVIYYVSGPQGLPFQVLPEPIPGCAQGAGIQAANADHRFGQRIFRVPHFFVLENAFQPVRAVFVNVDDSPDPESMRVDLYFGTNLQATAPDVPPGECVTVTGEPGRVPDPVVGRQVRIEVCSRAPDGNRNAPCESDYPDAGVAFFASLGDIQATNLTSCQILPVAESCRTRATFFIEDAKEIVSAVFSKLSGQNPNSIMRAELYVNDRLENVDTGSGDIIVQHTL
jgi:hypothetical protein